MSIALTWSSTSGLSDLPAQSARITAGEAETITWSQVTGQTAVDISTWTLKFTMSPRAGSNPSVSRGDSAFSSKTAAGTCSLSITAENTEALPSRAFYFEFRRTDSGYETLLSYGFITVYQTAGASVNVPANTLLALEYGGTEADLSATGPGVVVQASAGAPLTISSYATILSAIGAQPLDADLTALAALSGTNTIYYRSGASTWSAVTVGSGLTFSGGTLDVGTSVVTLTGTQTLSNKTLTSPKIGTITDSGGLSSVDVENRRLIADDGVTVNIDFSASNVVICGNTWTAGTGTLTLGTGKTLTCSNTLTFTGTDSSSVAFGTGGTVFYTSGLGTNVQTALAVAVGSAGAVVVNGGALGTPSSGTLTNCTGTATGLTAGTATNATNVAITDDTTTNATVYLAWVGTASGNQAAKVSSTGITYNPSNGFLVTSGGFITGGSSIILRTDYAYFANTKILIQNGTKFQWQESDFSTISTGIDRSAAGVVRVTNGSTGYGKIEAKGMRLERLSGTPSSPPTGIVEYYCLDADGGAKLYSIDSSGTVRSVTLA